MSVGLEYDWGGPWGRPWLRVWLSQFTRTAAVEYEEYLLLDTLATVPLFSHPLGVAWGPPRTPGFPLD